MLFLIIKKEIVHNVLSLRFIATYALLFCLILLAMFLMTSDYRTRLQEYTTEVNKARDQLEKIEKIEDPGEQFQEFQRTDFAGVRSPRTLSILARGLEGSLPTRVSGTSWFVFRSSEERLGKNLLFTIFQTPDLVYVVTIVMSLLALLFVFDAICGEKEQGTLKLLLSNSVPRDIVLAGKWIGGYLSVIAPFSVAVLGGFAYIHFTGALELAGESLSRFALIYGLSLLYISAFFTLGLMISALTHRASTALLVALLVWIGWILVVPNLAPVVSRLTLPVPSRQVIDMEKQKIQQEGQLLIASASKRGLLKEGEKIQQEMQQDQNSLEEFYQDQMKNQVVRSQNLARLSPSASFLFAATRLAGTGPRLFEAFQKAQKRFQESREKYDQEMHWSAQVEWTRQGPRMKVPDWFNPDDLPRFRILEEPLSDSFNAASFDLLLLIVFNVLFFILSYVFFLRYDIT